jgi:hypothetical protein
VGEVGRMNVLRRRVVPSLGIVGSDGGSPKTTPPLAESATTQRTLDQKVESRLLELGESINKKLGKDDNIAVKEIIELKNLLRDVGKQNQSGVEFGVYLHDGYIEIYALSLDTHVAYIHTEHQFSQALNVISGYLDDPVGNWTGADAQQAIVKLATAMLNLDPKTPKEGIHGFFGVR